MASWIDRPSIHLMPASMLCKFQGCDCAATWVILATPDPNFVLSVINLNQVRHYFSAWLVGVFAAREHPFKYCDCKRSLDILANFALGRTHPGIDPWGSVSH